MPLDSPSEAWASTRSWGDSPNNEEKPLVRRDKYGRKIVEKEPLPSNVIEVPGLGRVKKPEHKMVAGHQGLMKKVLKVGDGARGTPPTGARIVLHAVGHLPVDKKGDRIKESATEGIKFFSTRERIVAEDASITTQECNAAGPPGPQHFILGSGSVLPAWELTVPTMLIGETCEIIISPEYGYGEEGASHLGVPPSCPLAFVLELVEWKAPRPPREVMADTERFTLATEYKFRGTECFKKQQWEDAMELYDDAAHYLSDAFFGAEAIKHATSIEHPDAVNSVCTPRQLVSGTVAKGPPPKRFDGNNDEAKALLLACLLNGAQCALKSEAWRKAEERASKALQLDTKNVKGLFRRGTARTRLGDYADARADLRKACELDPKSKDVREMFDECKIAEAAEKQAQRDFYANTRVAEGGVGEYKEEEPEKPFVC